MNIGTIFFKVKYLREDTKSKNELNYENSNISFFAISNILRSKDIS